MSLRLFAALEVADDVRERLAAAVGPVRGRYERLRWTPPHQWHLTIAFLGSVEEHRLAAVEEALAVAAATAPARIDLRLGPVGHFGRRVLWVGVAEEPPGAVAALGEAAQRALLAAGLPVDEKPVSPHITLARPGTRGRKLPAAVTDDVPVVEAAWHVDDLVLLSSVRGGHGEPNRYEVVTRFPLG